MDSYFNGKVAVVTGAGGTLCSAAAIDLASLGVKTVLVGRTEEKLIGTAEKIAAAGGECDICPCDVTDEAAVEKLASLIEQKQGGCDFLINGAGGNNSAVMTTEEAYVPHEEDGVERENFRGFFNLDISAFENVIKTNTMGSIIPTRAFGKLMARSGSGSIINFASMNSYCPLTKVPAYAMSKGAVVSMTKWLAAYLAPAGIRVNAIAPGFLSMSAALNSSERPKRVFLRAVKRLLTIRRWDASEMPMTFSDACAGCLTSVRRHLSRESRLQSTEDS